jgi:hypothetical protein
MIEAYGLKSPRRKRPRRILELYLELYASRQV